MPGTLLEGKPLLSKDVYDVQDSLKAAKSPTSCFQDDGPACKAGDIILVFPLPNKQDIDKDREVDGDQMLTSLFIHDEEAQEFSRLSAVCRGAKPKLEHIRSALLDDLCEWLPRKGFSVELFKSSVETNSGEVEHLLGYLSKYVTSHLEYDRIFMRISIACPEVERLYAERQAMQLQTTFELLTAMGIKQPPYPESSPPFLAYKKSLVETLEKELNLNEGQIFEKYFYTTADGSIFRSSDRLRMLAKAIFGKLLIESCQEQKLILTYFPGHASRAIEGLRRDWGSPSLSLLLDLNASQPYQHIRDYFGETTAFYFAWIGFTIKAFVPLAFLGILMKIVEVTQAAFWPSDYLAQNVWSTTWATVVVVWGSLYTVLWRRYEYRLRCEWNTLNNKAAQCIRPGLKGEIAKDPLNENDKILQYPPSRTRLWILLSIVIGIALLGVIMAFVGFLFRLRPKLDRWLGDDSLINGATLASSLLSMEIAIVNILWEQAARWLTRKENLQTANGYANSLMAKLFVFQFVNTYEALFYLAFLQKNLGVSPTSKSFTEAGEGVRLSSNCPEGDCIHALQWGLYSTMGGLVLGQLKALIWPYIKLKFLNYLEQKRLEAKRSKASVNTHELPFLERQGLMNEYDVDHQISDFQSLTLALSGAIVFAGVSPLLGIVALAIFVIRLRVDAWKLCVLLRRPFPHIEDGIGDWNLIIDAFMWIGLTVSVAVPVLNLDRFDDLDATAKLAMFLAIERSLVLVKVICGSLLPQTSADVQLMLDRRRYVTDKIQESFECVRPVEGILAKPIEVPTVSRAIDLDGLDADMA